MGTFTLSEATGKPAKKGIALSDVVEKPPSTIDNMLGGAGNLVYGLAKGLADPVYGASQLLLHGANSAYQAVTPKNLSGVVTGRPNNAMQRLTDQYDNLISGVENQYQAETPGSVPAGIGRVVGNMLYPIKGGGVLKSAASGAGIGMAQPVVNQPDDYGAAKALQVGAGTILGGTLPVLGRIAGAAYNTVKPVSNPSATVGDMLLGGLKKTTGATPAGVSPAGAAGSVDAQITNLLGNRDPQAVLDRISSAPKFVNGSLPTTAQVAGIPQLVMAEKTLSNNPAYREAMLERANANNAARFSAVDSIAQTPEMLAKAIAERKAATSPLYDEATAMTHAIDDSMSGLLGRPSVKSAIARGQKLAQEKEQSALPTSGIPATAASEIPTGLLDSQGNPFTRAVAAAPAVPGTVSGQTLQYMKMGLADLQQEGKRNGMGAHEQEALSGTASDLHNWLLSKAPAYKAADAEFAARSVPINTMQAGQAVRAAMRENSRNSAGDLQATFPGFKKVINDALADQPYGIHPDAQSVFDGIKSDMQRQTISNSVTSAGSDTAFNLQAPNWLSGKLFGAGLAGDSKIAPTVIGGALGSLFGSPGAGAAVGNAVGRGAGEFVGNRVNTQFQRAMLEPEYFSQLVTEALARQKGNLGGNGLLNPNVSQGAAVSGEGLLNSFFSGN